MKKLIYLFSGVIVLLGIIHFSYASNTENEPSKDGSIIILSSPDLTNLTNSWAIEYTKLNPGKQIKVLDIGDKNIYKPIQSGSQLEFVSKKYLNETNNQALWEIVVGREIFVPIINQNNPLIEQIYNEGISSEDLARFLDNKKSQTWATLLGNGVNNPVHFYILNNEAAEASLAAFTKIDLKKFNTVIVSNASDLIASVEADIYSIGFCRVTDIIDLQNNQILPGLALLPIDKNGNGQIDSFEEIYSGLNTFSRGVWIGKYPQELVSNIYLVSSQKPSNDADKAFLKWVLTGGQKVLSSNGFSGLASSERNSKLSKLLEEKFITIQPANNYAGWKIAVMVFIFLMVLAFIIEIIVLSVKHRLSKIKDENFEKKSVFSENSVNTPGGLFFDKTHTWAFMENNGVVKIGIDDFLPRITGELTGVKMKKTGDKIKKDEVLVSLIQSGKQLSIKSPVSGTVIEENNQLNDNPSLINTSPYVDGWVYTIKPSNWLREIQFLFMADKFKLWLKSEFLRVKDFIAFVQKSNEINYSPLILQEGGEFKEGVLMNFGPEVWEEFQSNFIDTTD